MSVVINTNSSAANNLAISDDLLERSLNRLASGTRTVGPPGDAGGLSVSMKLSAAANRQGGVVVNIGNVVSLRQIQDGALEVRGKVPERMKARKRRSSRSNKKLRA